MKSFLHASSLVVLLAFITSMVFAQETDAPAAMLLPESALPAYEKEIDHAGMIRSWDKGSLERGREIYQRICHNCHGDLAVAGSIPNSMRFGTGSFQHGKDPYTLYQTITRGWRLMVPQPQLVPQEKYDVIHYLRETFLREHNPNEYFEPTPDYLDGLPKGSSRGPAPVKREPWREMDYGPSLTGTFEIADETDRTTHPPEGSPADYVAPDANIAYKAIAMRLDEGPGGIAAGKAWIAFEHDTMRVAGIWTGDGFIDWHGINFDGRHVVRPRTIGELHHETADVPGWANPETGNFDDARIRGLDDRPYGPLPREWAKFRGTYRHGATTVISYEIGGVPVLEGFALESIQPLVVARTLEIGESGKDLAVRVANAGTKVSLRGAGPLEIVNEAGFSVVRIPADATPLRLGVVYGDGDEIAIAFPDLESLTQGGPAQWPEPIETVVVRGEENGAFAVDSFSLPPQETNPRRNWMRMSGLNFLPDGQSAVLCTWDGDVWTAAGLGGNDSTIRWRQIASGLFQPLGIKVVGEDIFVSCRDQIVRLRDLDGDGETDFYECFNSDHQVTEHFHEFAMGLQADPEGNLYYAKSARHARPPLVPQHGTLLRVGADGASTEILANGFRAANGVWRETDGTFYVTDQEGHWNPMNRINRVVPGGRFYGNMWSHGAPEDSSDEAMEAPLCWVDKGFDRSPSELLRVESDSWGSLDGALLNLSYGFGRIEIVPHESFGETWQGGVAALPIPDFATGVMRGRFRPDDGHLYLCGMSAWGTAQLHLPGGFYRVRATGKPAHAPIGIRAHDKGLSITFSDPLAADGHEIDVRSWNLQRSAQYGSKHHDERSEKVNSLAISEDGRTLEIGIEEIRPVWQMAIRYRLRTDDGETVEGELQNTIHALGPSR